MRIHFCSTYCILYQIGSIVTISKAVSICLYWLDGQENYWFLLSTNFPFTFLLFVKCNLTGLCLTYSLTDINLEFWKLVLLFAVFDNCYAKIILYLYPTLALVLQKCVIDSNARYPGAQNANTYVWQHYIFYWVILTLNWEYVDDTPLLCFS